jgi:hypothetical protein
MSIILVVSEQTQSGNQLSLMIIALTIVVLLRAAPVWDLQQLQGLPVLDLLPTRGYPETKLAQLQAV